MFSALLLLSVLGSSFEQEKIFTEVSEISLKHEAIGLISATA